MYIQGNYVMMCAKITGNFLGFAVYKSLRVWIMNSSHLRPWSNASPDKWVEVFCDLRSLLLEGKKQEVIVIEERPTPKTIKIFCVYLLKTFVLYVRKVWIHALRWIKFGSRFLTILNASSVSFYARRGGTPPGLQCAGAVQEKRSLCSASRLWFIVTVSHLPAAVFALSMATTASGAPLPENSSLVGTPQFQEILKDSSSLTHKILQSILGAHRSCVNVEVRRGADCGSTAPKQNLEEQI